MVKPMVVVGQLFKKIKELYHINIFTLCGGAEINAVFLKADLVDEISIVIGPVIDGNRNVLTFVGTENTDGFPKYFKLKEVEKLDNNGVILRYIK